MEFLSERNVLMHKEYLGRLIAERAIFEKSYTNKPPPRREAVLWQRLDFEIYCHKLYFSSFARHSPKIRIDTRWNGSPAEILYKIKKACDELSRGFVLIYPGGNILSVDADCEKAIPKKQAVLAIDMCEHAYFLDYGFDRSAYVGQLLKFLDLSRI